MTNLGHRRATRFSSVSQLSQESRVVDRGPAEPAFAELMRSAERLNVVDQVVHDRDMRRICPSRQEADGLIRKLCATADLWDRAHVPEQSFDIELIKRVLLDATKPGGDFSQRSLDTQAQVTRGTVGEIIRGKNKNPTTAVLSALATALGGDLSMFGLADRPAQIPSGQKLVETMAALLDNAGLGHLADEYAEKLARLLPTLLEESEAPVEPEGLAEERPAAERAPRLATAGHDTRQ